jgi:hypothetical protein
LRGLRSFPEAGEALRAATGLASYGTKVLPKASMRSARALRFADNVGERQSGHEEHDLTMSEANAFFLLDSIG